MDLTSFLLTVSDLLGSRLTQCHERGALAALHPQPPRMRLGDDQAGRRNRGDRGPGASPGQQAGQTSGHGPASTEWRPAAGPKRRRPLISNRKASTAGGAATSSTVTPKGLRTARARLAMATRTASARTQTGAPVEVASTNPASDANRTESARSSMTVSWCARAGDRSGIKAMAAATRLVATVASCKG